MSPLARLSLIPILLVLAATTSAQHHSSASFASHVSFGGHQVHGGAGPYLPATNFTGHVSGFHGGPGPIVGGQGGAPFAGGANLFGPGGGGPAGFGNGGGFNFANGGGFAFGGGLGFPVGAVGGGGGFGGFGIGGFGVPVITPFPVFVGPQVGFPMLGNQPFGIGQGVGGLMLPMPGNAGSTNVARPRRPNPDRARELLEIGDRSFRGGNIHRAEERYLLSAKADPSSPMTFIHLAQVSIVRKDYAKAASQIRAAVAATRGPGWLTNAPDIQTMYLEPGDFARQLGRIESHLQANPGDRDAWFVLGVELYLSGRTQPAADAFQRISDRRADEALTAFVDASKPRRADAN